MILFATIVLFLSLAYFVVLVLFRRGFEKNTLDVVDRRKKSTDQAVSIVVPMRNEEENIEQCVNSILKSQTTRLVELIIVNDHSTDRSKEIVLRIQKTSKFKIRLLDTQKNGKKAAISCGIQLASHPLIYLTDSDCVLKPNTLETMLRELSDDVEMVTGPVLFSNEGSIFVQMQNLDLLGLVAVGAGSLKLGLATMCNGANLGFKKSAFERVGGYLGNESISSGDDLFLMHKIYKEKPSSVQFCADLDAVVKTKAETRMAPFFSQRRRWASKGRHYLDSRLRVLSLLVWGVNLGILILPLMLVWNSSIKYFFLGSFLLKLLADFQLLDSASSHFKKRNLLKYFIPEQLLHIPYVVFVGLSSQFGKIFWKEREIAR